MSEQAQTPGSFISLLSCIRTCEQAWLQEYEQLARQDNTEALIIYGQLMLRGAGNRPANTALALRCLKQAARHSAEAAYKLGKIYQKGKGQVGKDLEEAYFYYKVSTLFKCKCGKYRDAYHTGRISTAHPCFPTDARTALDLLPATPDLEERFREKYIKWRDHPNYNF